ncbi:Utp14 protein-domain-containing protein [Crepidotus variabilis]|uniref:Utp14 protein-domain-containing protein n=1 Tax=Crepidotus variabilis TaxID=179855 RepID=A0A9P6JPR7_9AGAR|nr:Utp14 protein-domain-containing protein [Crepidotus variabilis]
MKSFQKSGRSSTNYLSQNFGKSQSKANASGYEKRVARTAAKAINSTADIYEHVPEKTRRSNVTVDLDRDEAWEFGSMNDASQEQINSLRARLIGENGDDEDIASEDDEELDSDAAFEESDEERFAGFFSSKTLKSQKTHKKLPPRLAEVDLNEDDGMLSASEQEQQSDEEEEEGDDDEFLDILDVLDGKGELFTGSADEKASLTRGVNSNLLEQTTQLESVDKEDEDEDDEEKSQESSEDEDHDMLLAPSDNEDFPDALNQLNDFVSGLDTSTKKRKIRDGESEGAQIGAERARKRRLLKEKTEAGEENEFRVQSTGAKLNLDDLLAPLASQSSALQSLKKSTKVLSSSSLKNQTLSAPLPQRAQERLDREAAYEQTKQEAEHLSFPLQAQNTSRVSNLELNAKFKPTTELETAIDSLLKAAKLREEDPHVTEDATLEMNNLSVEEIAERQSELRKMRELMFRAETKSRRVSKIKSRAYRRLRRKEKERLGEKINEKDDEDDSETEEGRLKREYERAKERATLRHKHTGKWAKQMRGREGLDDGSRREIEEMLSRGEKLRKRIQGIGSGESEDQDNDDDDDEGFDINEGIAKIKQDAFSELAGLERDVAEREGRQKSKSVFQLKFMKDAMARQTTEANREVDDFVKEMGGEVEEDSDKEVVVIGEVQDPSSGVVSVRAGGRVVFRPGTSTESLAPPPSDTSSVTLQSTDLFSPPPQVSSSKRRGGVSAATAEVSNPWLVRDDLKASKATKKVNAIVVGKDSKAMDKAKHKVKKTTQKLEQEKERAEDDAVVEISLDNVLKLPSNKFEDIPNDSSVDSEVEAQEKTIVMKGKTKTNGLKAFEQRDLVSLAFAGDNVVQCFEDAKRREIAADAPHEVDTTIPGWGSWGGSGVKKAPHKPHRIKKIAGIDPKTRADYGKKNIIISEKRDKKAAKYLVKDLPYPYTSKAQFERAMEHPLGVEWNTRQGFQRATLPRVVKKPGIIIEPLEKLL